MAILHGPREQRTPQLPGKPGGYGFFKEDPHVSTLPRAGSLKVRRDTHRPARVKEGYAVLLPPGFIKISGEEPTGFVGQKRIHAEDLLSDKMLSNRLAAYRDVL
jgi:hypothetical protein